MTDTAFTPTQAKILALLSDGRPHTRAEIRRLLPDEYAKTAAIRKHIHRIRQSLPEGEEIRCVYDGPTLCYQRFVRFNLIGPDLPREQNK